MVEPQKLQQRGVSPPMGSGSLPGFDYKKVGFFGQIKIVGPDYVMIDIDRSLVAKNVDTVYSCYNLHYLDNRGKQYAQVISYGGPGGASCGI